MPRVRVDGEEFVVAAGLSVLQAARTRGIEIPHLCFAEGCDAETSCLVCLVRIDGVRRLVPSCATPVAEGMVIHTNSPEVRESRRTALELILAEHTGDCFAPCTNICPAHLDIPGMIRAFSAGNLREAAELARDALVLPATLGAVCHSLCEHGCRREETGGAVAIHALHRQIAELDLSGRDPWMPSLPPAVAERVAIIGAGPAGLTAAYELRKLGHSVDVFDRREDAGGSLRDAIAVAELPLLEAETTLLARMGIAFHFKQTVGATIQLAKLQEDFAAVLVAVGELTEDEAEAMGLPRSPSERQVNRMNYRLPLPRLFVAGAAMSKFEHAIRAVADGRTAAKAIHASLAGQILPARPRFAVRLGKLTPGEMTTLLASSNLQPCVLGNDVPSTPLSALSEASRCAHCGCTAVGSCRLRRYAIEYDCDPTRYRRERRVFKRTVTPSHVSFEPGKCIACGLCVQVTRKHKEELGLTFVGRGFDIRVSAAFNEPLEAALKKCAKEACDICPTGALGQFGEPDAG